MNEATQETQAGKRKYASLTFRPTRQQQERLGGLTKDQRRKVSHELRQALTVILNAPELESKPLVKTGPETAP